MAHFKKQNFRKKGYIVLRDFFPSPIQEAFREETDRLPGHSELPSWYTPSLSMANNPGFTTYLESIIGSSVSKKPKERVGPYQNATPDSRYHVMYVISQETAEPVKVTMLGNSFGDAVDLTPGTIVVSDTSRTKQREHKASYPASIKVYVMEF